MSKRQPAPPLYKKVNSSLWRVFITVSSSGATAAWQVFLTGSRDVETVKAAEDWRDCCGGVYVIFPSDPVESWMFYHWETSESRHLLYSMCVLQSNQKQGYLGRHFLDFSSGIMSIKPNFAII